MLINVYQPFQPEGHQEPLRVKVGSLSLAEHLVGFEVGTILLSFYCDLDKLTC